MNFLEALFIKFVIITAVLWMIVGAFSGVYYPTILMLSVMLTGVAFVIGDLLILPYFGNWVATIADFGLAFFGIWVFGSMLSLPISLGAFSVISAFLIAIGESFFHAYMNRYILTNPYEKDEVASISQHKLQTEFSQEIDVTSDLKHVRDDKE